MFVSLPLLNPLPFHVPPQNARLAETTHLPRVNEWLDVLLKYEPDPQVRITPILKDGKTRVFLHSSEAAMRTPEP